MDNENNQIPEDIFYNKEYIIKNLINYYGEVDELIKEYEIEKSSLEEIILDYFEIADLDNEPVDFIKTDYIKAERKNKNIGKSKNVTQRDIASIDKDNYNKYFNIKKTFKVSEYFVNKLKHEEEYEKNIHKTYIDYLNLGRESDKKKLIEYVIYNNELWILEKKSTSNIVDETKNYTLNISKL